MSLIVAQSTKTNFKSLKYGQDRLNSLGGTSLGGGNSGQPYIIKDIPSGNQLPGRLFGQGYPGTDFLFRGGAIIGQSALEDVKRLGSWLFAPSNPLNGVLFTAKQNLLSNSAVRTQTSGIFNEGVYTPLSTLAQAGLVAFGGHLNKQGVNPFEDTGAYAQNNRLYYNKISKTGTSEFGLASAKDNRLVGLFARKILTQMSDLRYFNPKENNISDSPINILTYKGGPGPPLGVGFTNIRFATGPTPGSSRTGDNNPTIKNNPYTLTGDQINKLGDTTNPPGQNISSPKIINFRAILRNKIASTSGANPLSPDYSEQNVENRVGLGSPGQRANKDYSSYTSGVNYNDKAIKALDQITALPIYQSDNIQSEIGPGKASTNDLVTFAIAAIKTDTPNLKDFIHFRAFIDSFDDNYTSNWNPTQYLGRGEQFYTYSRFDRTLNMTFKVVAQSRQELLMMYAKLNFLASNLAPDYTPKGYMAGSLIQITVGDYVKNQTGFITNLRLSIPQESPWEINIDDSGEFDKGGLGQLPHIIEASMAFTPIHNFAVRKQELTLNNDQDKIVQGYGAQKYILNNLSPDYTVNNNIITPPSTTSQTPPSTTSQTPPNTIYKQPPKLLKKLVNIIAGSSGGIFNTGDNDPLILNPPNF